MRKIDSRIDIRISAKDKETLINFCLNNNIKLSTLLRNCALNLVREVEKIENENKEEEK